jgi:hypothetical protein
MEWDVVAVVANIVLAFLLILSELMSLSKCESNGVIDFFLKYKNRCGGEERE